MSKKQAQKDLIKIAKDLSDKDIFLKEPTSYLLNFIFLRKLVKKHTGKFLKIKELEDLANIIQSKYGIGQIQKGGQIKSGDLAKMANQLSNKKNAIDKNMKLDLLALHRLVKKHFGSKLSTGNLQKLASILHHDYGIPATKPAKKTKPQI